MFRGMENATLTFHAPVDKTAALEQAHAARLAYEQAVNSDGTSAAVWQSIHEDMHATADLMEAAGALAGVVQSHRDRAVDAGQRATYARRMVEVARGYRVIDMSTLSTAVSS